MNHDDSTKTSLLQALKREASFLAGPWLRRAHRSSYTRTIESNSITRLPFDFVRTYIRELWRGFCTRPRAFIMLAGLLGILVGGVTGWDKVTGMGTVLFIGMLLLGV